MVSDQISFDLSDLEEGIYKSCFARSMAVNSQIKHSKLDFFTKANSEGTTFERDTLLSTNVPQQPVADLGKHRKTSSCSQFEEKYSSSSFARRGSLCSSGIVEMPVENIFLQSQIETLQWQLKQTESSREMYREVMKQVVVFLEKAHQSLQMLGSRINTNETVHRSQSEHQVTTLNGDSSTDTLGHLNNSKPDYTAFKDFTWRRPKKQLPTDEIPPDKLSQEAFRLLRTAQSLLNTREPDLAHVKEPEDDFEFLNQLAKEFPQTDTRPQRTPSFSSSPKLLLSDKDSQLSAVFNRKLSLPLNCNDLRRNSLHKETLMKSRAGTPQGNHNDGFNRELRGSGNSQKSLNSNKFKMEPEKSNSPPTGSISSADGESGFSSMNSCQDIGLPPVNSSISEEITTKDVLLRSMLHEEPFYPNGYPQMVTSSPVRNEKNFHGPKCKNIDDFKLWQKPENVPFHKRRNSTPVASLNKEKPALKVLWV